MLGHFFRYTTNFKQNSSWADNSCPMVWSAFSFSHTSLSWLFGYRFIGKNADPNFTTTVKITVNSNTACFDLMVCQTTAVKCLHAKFTEIEKIRSFAKTSMWAFCHLMKVCTFGH